MKKKQNKNPEKRKKNINMVLSNIIRVLLVIFLIINFFTGDHSQDFLIVVTFALTYYPSILEKRFGVYLPKRLQIVITLFIFAAQVLGELADFYERIPWWDTMLHTISGVVLGLVGFLFVYLLNEKGNVNVNLSPKFVIIFAFCFALTMGVFWEFFEYGADRIFGFNMQKFRFEGQDGLVDTMNDLIVDALGALFACVCGHFYIKKYKDTLFNDYFDDWFEGERKRNEMIRKQKEVEIEEQKKNGAQE